MASTSPPPARGGAPKRRRDWASRALFAAFALLYFATFTARADGVLFGNDVIPYAVQAAAGAEEGRWNPHHLLFHPLAEVATAVWCTVTLQPISVPAALEGHRLLSALGGAAAVVVVFRFARRITSRDAAFAWACAFGFSSGVWLYSTVGETYMPATAVTALLLARCIDERLQLRRTSPVLLGGLLYLAVLLRQDSVLVVPAVLALLPWRFGLATVGGAGCAAVGMYGFAWLLSGSELGFFSWLRGLEASGLWGGAPTLGQYAENAGVSARVTLMALNYGALRSIPWGLLSLGLLVAAVLPPRRPGRNVRSVLLGLLAYAALRFAFFSWWQPSNMEYHTGTLVPMFLALPLLWNPGLVGLRRRFRDAFLAAAAVSLAISAWLTLFGGMRGTEISERARLALDRAGDAGLVVSVDRWFHYSLLREGADAQRAVDASDYTTGVYEQLPDRPDPLPELKRRIGRTLLDGGRVVVAGDRVLATFYGNDNDDWGASPERVAALIGDAEFEPLLDPEGRAWAYVLSTP